MKLEKFSIGIGDRFGHQGAAQLRALLRAREEGIEAVPVWNKSHREHTIIGSTPEDTRAAAERAVKDVGWKRSWHTDADHIGLATVDAFVPWCDFFTIDVADLIGQTAPPEEISGFLSFAGRYAGKRLLPDSAPVTADFLETCAGKYLAATGEAGRIYRRIAEVRGNTDFITEVSLDEAEAAQSPDELFFILAALAREKIPLNTVAPKWSGRFNKGVDFAGDAERFGEEFAAAVDAIDLAVQEFGLADSLKLSLHSGSDKFSLYPYIKRTLDESDAGLHVKTAGTTWLEEAIGLAAAGGDGWELVREIYRTALERFDDVCRPYAAVLDIDREALPTAQTVEGWSGEDFVRALRHDSGEPGYNPHLRQLMHVSYGLAAEKGGAFTGLLEANAELVGAHVTENLLERHIRAIFPRRRILTANG